MLAAAFSSLPTLASQRGDSRAKKLMIMIIPANIMWRMVASIHWSAVLFEIWSDVPQFAKYPSMIPR
jgi:hypothetical protein